MPRVIVAIPHLDRATMLQEALKSVLAQTYRDFSVVVVDDYSKSSEVPRFESPKVDIWRNEARKGIVHSLNRIITNTDSEFIARLDSDDLMVPGRLQRQVDFMTRNPHVGVLGSAIKHFGASTHSYRPPLGHGSIVLRMLFENCIAHPAVTIRRAALKNLEGPYRADFEHAEDWDLWERMTEQWHLANLSETLTLVRRHPEQISRNGPPESTQRAEEVRKRFGTRLGIDLAALRPGLIPLFSLLLRRSFSASRNQILLVDLLRAYEMNLNLSNRLKKIRFRGAHS